MSISTQEKRALGAKAHALKPVIITGSKGLTDSVITETNNALDIHELVKIRINIEDKEQFQLAINEIVEKTKATFIKSIGHVGVFYRKHPKTDKKTAAKSSGQKQHAHGANNQRRSGGPTAAGPQKRTFRRMSGG